MQKPHSMPQHEQYKCWSQTNENSHELKSPLRCPAKSQPGEPKPYEDSSEGSRNKLWELSSKGIGWTNIPVWENIRRPTRKKYSHPQIKQNRELTGGSKDIQAIPWPKCPPHSPEETYERWASVQNHSIHFCNGCSARDTRPQNLTRVVFSKSSLC